MTAGDNYMYYNDEWLGSQHSTALAKPVWCSSVYPLFIKKM